MTMAQDLSPELVRALLALRQQSAGELSSGGDARTWAGTGDLAGYSITDAPGEGQWIGGESGYYQPGAMRTRIGGDFKNKTFGVERNAVYDDTGKFIDYSSGDSDLLSLAKFIAASVGGYYGAQGLEGALGGAANAGVGGMTAAEQAAFLEANMGALAPGAGYGGTVAGGSLAAGSAPSTLALDAASLAPIEFAPITAETLGTVSAAPAVAGGAAAGGAASGGAAGGGAAGGGAASGAGNMSWADWAQIGASLASSAMNSKAAGDAADAQIAASKEATALQKGMYDETVKRNEPFVQGGRQAFDALLMRLGLAGDKADPNFGSLSRQITPEEVMQSPGYQFGLEQGRNALSRGLNARGLSGSGAAMKAATRYGTDYATTKYGENYSRMSSAQQDIYNRLMGVTGVGQSSANNTAAAGNIFASQAGQNTIGAGNAAAANSLAQGSIWSNALNQGVSIYNDMNRRRPADRNWVTGAGYERFTSDDYGQYF